MVHIHFLNTNPWSKNNSRLVQDHELEGSTLQMDAYIHNPVLAQDYFSDHELGRLHTTARDV